MSWAEFWFVSLKFVFAQDPAWQNSSSFFVPFLIFESRKTERNWFYQETEMDSMGWFTSQLPAVAVGELGWSQGPWTVWVSHVGHKNPLTAAIIHGFLGCTLAGTGMRKGAWIWTQGLMLVGIGSPKWHFNCCAKNPHYFFSAQSQKTILNLEILPLAWHFILYWQLEGWGTFFSWRIFASYVLVPNFSPVPSNNWGCSYLCQSFQEFVENGVNVHYLNHLTFPPWLLSSGKFSLVLLFLQS